MHCLCYWSLHQLLNLAPTTAPIISDMRLCTAQSSTNPSWPAYRTDPRQPATITISNRVRADGSGLVALIMPKSVLSTRWPFSLLYHPHNSLTASHKFELLLLRWSFWFSMFSDMVGGFKRLINQHLLTIPMPIIHYRETCVRIS